MKLNNILLPALLVAALAILPGCKKENTETKTLSGYLSVELPPYMGGGETKTFMIDTLMTLICPDGETIGYYFRDETTQSNDTLVTADGKILKHYYTYTAPSTKGDAKLTLAGFMGRDSKYSGFSTSYTTTVVFPGLSGSGSITGFDKEGSWTYRDFRDGRTYYCSIIGDLFWMRQNLAWDEAGVPFEGCGVMTDVFGRYYTWEEAQTACPNGWRLPTDAEVVALQENAAASKDIPGLAGKLMADLYFNDTRMWEYWRDVKITDELCFSAIPVGYGLVAEGSYDFQGDFKYAVFWTSDEEDGYGICRYIYQNKDIVYRGRMSKTDFVAPVRCVME
ncbi:MAG: hypothetical protein J6S99_00160 [Bacteroidales bacterium]|nr:hypothetical protein [Bacteroidales bacterium]